MIKVKVNGEYWYNTVLSDNNSTVQVEESDLEQIGITKKFEFGAVTKKRNAFKETTDEKTGRLKVEITGTEEYQTDGWYVTDMTQQEIAAKQAQRDTWAAQAQSEADKTAQIAALKRELAAISEDIVQDIAGKYVPNIADKKARFMIAHDQLRTLEGKEPRAAKEEN